MQRLAQNYHEVKRPTMHCPYCQHSETTVVETRDHDAGDAIRRRRECAACQKRFTTFERVDLELPKIIKRDGTREDYARSKLKASFALALRKRQISNDSVENAIERIESALFQLGEREVASGHIGQLVMRELAVLDKVAYVRYASVYRNFTDPTDFAQAVREINKPSPPGTA